jgi:hypothetical protein
VKYRVENDVGYMKITSFTEKTFDDLDTLIRARTPVEVRELGTFWTGAVGFFAYDVVRLIERLPSPPKRLNSGPDDDHRFNALPLAEPGNDGED